MWMKRPGRCMLEEERDREAIMVFASWFCHCRESVYDCQMCLLMLATPLCICNSVRLTVLVDLYSVRVIGLRVLCGGGDFCARRVSVQLSVQLDACGCLPYGAKRQSPGRRGDHDTGADAGWRPANRDGGGAVTSPLCPPLPG